MGDSLTISGNGTHNFNGSIITTNGSKTIIENNALINSSGNFYIDNNSYLRVEGDIINNGSIFINESATLFISDSYMSNSSGQIYMSDYSLMHVLGYFSLSHNIVYNGGLFFGSMIILESMANINTPVSQDVLVNVCTSQSLTNIQLGNATLSCDNLGFYGSNGLITLPVELGSFSAFYNGYHTCVNWKTLSEINSDYFILEYSEDLVNWKTVSRISSIGNTSIGGEYSVIDFKWSPYYRLIQFDFDGRSEIFGPFSTQSVFNELLYYIHNGYIFIEKYTDYQFIKIDGSVISKGFVTSGYPIEIPDGLSILIINNVVILRLFK